MSYPFTLIFLEGAQASWQRRSEAITRDLDSRSSLLPIFLNCKLSKIAVLQEPNCLRQLFYKNQSGEQQLENLCLLKTSERLLIKGHKKGDQGFLEVMSEASWHPHFRFGIAMLHSLEDLLLYPAPEYSWALSRLECFSTFPHFQKSQQSSRVCKSSGFFWSSSWNHSSQISFRNHLQATFKAHVSPTSFGFVKCSLSPK